MIAAQALHLAFEKFTLSRSCSLIVALGDEEIPQGSDCSQTEVVVPAERTVHIPGDSF